MTKQAVTPAGVRLPDFLGIGAQKSGTTWLDGMLRTHPDLHLPRWRKEVHYFDHNYSRGIDWYSRFFPDHADVGADGRVGETTPRYLFEPSAPSRIRELLPNCRFLVILRDPVTRAFSQYRHDMRTAGIRVPFAQYVAGEAEAYRRGLYAEQLQRYHAMFPRDRFLVLIFEEVMRDRQQALRKVAHFLDVPYRAFDLDTLNRRVNEARVPRFGPVYRSLKTIGRGLRAVGLDAVVTTAGGWVGRTLFAGAPDSEATMPERDRRDLGDRYRASIEALEHLLDHDLSLWTDLFTPNGSV